jgi:uncharacterized protein YrrD
MLTLINQYIGMPVLSLRTGGIVGSLVEPLINPNNLRIEAWFVQDRFNNGRLVLRREDIRDIIEKGLVIDDHEVLAAPEDLVRLQEILSIRYDPIGKDVRTVSQQKVGRIYDYAVDEKTFYIKKLYASQRFIKSVVGSDSSIDRTQIVEITDRAIIVRDTTVPAFAASEQAAPA